MKLGIMQPYFMPYIGYWQLMNAADEYVVYDDVNFIKGGWINRNRILVNGEPKYINVQMRGASPFKKINEIEVANDEADIKKKLRMLENSYRKAPYFEIGYQMMEEIFQSGKTDLASYILYSFERVADYLDIKTKLTVSSTIEKDNELKGQDKVLEICKRLGATEYYNAIGGQELYSFDVFKENGIELSFLKTGDIRYAQYDNEFQPSLSMIDVLMFNSKEQIKEMLEDYTLIKKES